MQLLMDHSDEGDSRCLGLVPGNVKRLPSGAKVPHMGWNQVNLQREHPLFEGIPSGSNFYFVHSYYAEPEDGSIALGMTDYIIPFCSVIAHGNLVATQFHPEKSGTLGLRVYENFVRFAADGAG
jgi:glutamine amidotransferase